MPEEDKDKGESRQSREMITGWAAMDGDKFGESKHRSRPNSMSSSGLSILQQSIGDPNRSMHSSMYS